jgi:2-hydroxy-4-(methylsulfanyl)butanoate S-methyltransferase
VLNFLNGRDFAAYKSLLDVGGGSGGISIAACNANPGLSATIVELPRIAPFAVACAAEAKTFESNQS